MFASLTRCLFAATLFAMCSLLLACNTKPPDDTSTAPPTASAQPVSSAQPASSAPDSGAQTTSGNFMGFLDVADCNTIWGWAADKKQPPNSPVNVEILSDGQPITTVAATLYRWSVAETTGDKGYHGFTFNTPPTLRDGNAHVIRVKIAKTNFELTNSPRTIICQ